MTESDLLERALEEAFIESFKIHFGGFVSQLHDRPEIGLDHIETQARYFKRALTDMVLGLREAKKAIGVIADDEDVIKHLSNQ